MLLLRKYISNSSVGMKCSCLICFHDRNVTRMAQRLITLQSQVTVRGCYEWSEDGRRLVPVCL